MSNSNPEKQRVSINSDNYQEYLYRIGQYAQNYRMSNYGYDWKYFQAMSSAMSRRRQSFRLDRVQNTEFYGIYRRFEIIDGKLHYICGQSMNEEMLTVLTCITGMREWEYVDYR